MKRMTLLILLLGISASALWAGLERGKVYALAYLEEDFRGEEYRIPVPVQVPNSTNLLRVLGLPTDRLASLKVPPGVRVTLYDHKGYGGRRQSFEGKAPSLGIMKDTASSLKAELIKKP